MYTREEWGNHADRLSVISNEIKTEADYWESQEQTEVADFLRLRAYTLDLKAARIRLQFSSCSQTKNKQ